MKIKTSDLTGIALNWVVSKCEGDMPQYKEPEWTQKFLRLQGSLSYSTNWLLGGPIIEREFIDIFHQNNGYAGAILMSTHNNPHPTPSFATTPLIAVMRCYVASKLGDAVEVPDELTC